MHAEVRLLIVPGRGVRLRPTYLQQLVDGGLRLELPAVLCRLGEFGGLGLGGHSAVGYEYGSVWLSGVELRGICGEEDCSWHGVLWL